MKCLMSGRSGHPDAGPFDLLCRVAFNLPPRTPSEQARRLRADCPGLWEQYGPEARAILGQLLEKYAAHGTSQFVMPAALEVPPISEYGNVMGITEKFGGENRLAEAVRQLQHSLYWA